MELSFQNSNFKLVVISLFVAVVLFWVIISGLNKGKAIAQSEVVYNNSENFIKGLDLFYNDQGRFPTISEFNEPAIMLNYFSSFPPFNFVTNNCSQSYIYKIDSNNTYTFNYCLSVGYNTALSGWNQVIGSIK